MRLRFPQRSRQRSFTCTRIRLNSCKTHEHQITRSILRIAYVTTLGMAIIFALPQAAHGQSVTPPLVPAGLEVPAPNQPFLLGHAVGTQNYVCQPSGHLGRVAWILFTPQATLFDEQSAQIVTHFSSPNPAEDRVVRATWQDSRDTSTVWARAIASAIVDSNAIAWLKLEVAGTQLGPTGGDALSRTTFVQQLNTVGGLPPTTGCAALPDVGRKAFVSYAADYFFYRQ